MERGGCDETVKLFIGIQLVQVQPGQSRSGQAGSECCHSSGDWRVRSLTAFGVGKGRSLWWNCQFAN